MPARTTILIVFLTLFTSALVIYSLILDSQHTKPQPISQKPVPTTTPVPKNASLTFNPASVTIATYASESGHTDVVLSAPNNRITNVQVELSYDPKAFLSVKLATPSAIFWGSDNNYQVFNQYVDDTNGRISYMAGVKQGSNPVSGEGAVVSIIYKVNPLTLGSGTTIKMLNKSLAMQDGTNESVLGNMQNFTITSALPTRAVITTVPTTIPTATPTLH